MHQLWNPGDTPTHATWSTRPAGRTREWFAGLDALKNIPGPLALAVLLAALGRLRGHRLPTPPRPTPIRAA